MNILFDLTMQQLLSRLVGYLLIAALHGYAIAGLARLLGDQGPVHDGRLTVNPLAHLSMPAMAMAALLQIAWIRPVAIEAQKLRFGRFGLVMIALGALLLTLALVPVLGVLRAFIAQSIPGTGGIGLLAILTSCQDLVLWFVALNILPLPMLTGALFLQAAVPASTVPLQRAGSGVAAILVILAVTGVLPALASLGHDVLKSLPLA